MKLAYALLAKYADMAPDGTFSVHGGGINAADVSSLPAAWPLLGVVVRVEVTHAETRVKHLLRLVVTGPEGGELPGEVRSSMAPVAGPLANSEHVAVTCVMNLVNLPLSVEGDHTVHFFVDAEELASLPFRVEIKAPEGGMAWGGGAMSEDLEESAAAEKVAAFRLSNETLKVIASRHKPPQSWYDTDENLF